MPYVNRPYITPVETLKETFDLFMYGRDKPGDTGEA
jgi:hypothetical protein